MQTILETNPCQGIRNPCSNANFCFEILLSRINLSLRDHWDLFSYGRTIAQKICKRASQGGRLRIEAYITDGLIVLLEKRIFFVYVVLKAVKLYNRFTILYDAASTLKKKKIPLGGIL